MQKIIGKNIKNIFIRMPDWVGTFVLATPVLKVIRDNFPESRISVCVRSWSKELLNNCSYINEIINYDSKSASLSYHIGFIRELKKKHFDLAIVLPGSLNSALIPYFAGVKNRVGYVGNGRRLFLNYPLVDTGDKLFTELLSKAGFKVSKDVKPELWISGEDEKYAEKIWVDYGLANTKVIGMGVGVKGESSRKWPEEYFVELINLLADYIKIVLFGSKEDEHIGKNIEEKVNKKIINFTGQTTLNQFTAFMKKLNLYVTNSTGGMHIAGLYTRVIALFVPGDEKYWAPYGNQHIIICGEADCTPCTNRKMRYCKDNKCMKSITPERVLKYVQSI